MKDVLADRSRWVVEHGDSLVVLRSLPNACVDAIVTDPPAGISFMGKEFDHHRGGRDAWVKWLSTILAECYRVTRPGGRMLCWSIPRTMHWTGCAIEDAGWEIENTIAHVFGTGFPKAKSQLKPAREDWWLARKPAKHVLPLNIDECRIQTSDSLNGGAYATNGSERRDGAENWRYKRLGGAGEFVQPTGRWPANLCLSHVSPVPGVTEGCVRIGWRRIPTASNNGGPAGRTRNGTLGEFSGSAVAFDYGDADGKEVVAEYQCAPDCPVAELDRQSGTRQSGVYSAMGYHGNGEKPLPAIEGSSGGASRFFNTFEADPDDARFIYQAKASRSDRGEGNRHPTVKSTLLMRHLVRLITLPDDVVLDPFCGSGSTGKAAVLEGRRFIGIEREDTEAEPYVTIARTRISKVR